MWGQDVKKQLTFGAGKDMMWRQIWYFIVQTRQNKQYKDK